MNILEQKKKNIESQYQQVKNTILYQKMSGKSQQLIQSQNIQSFPSAFVLYQSRKAFREHQTSNSVSKYLGKIKIYTTQGVKIIPCGCQKYGVKCSLPQHNIQNQRTKVETEFDSQLRKFSKSLRSVRSQKCIQKIQRTANTDLKTSKPVGFRSKVKVSQFQTQQPIQSYGLIINHEIFQKQSKKSKLQLKIPKITENKCSFCLRKCQSFLCRSCIYFKGKK